jgi:pyridoxine/pyridoxamine 5'-phosphate oxidase
MAQGDAAARAELIRFLQRQRYGAVASLAADGAPQAAVVGIATGESGEIVFDTLATTRKAQNLRRDARVSLVVWEGERTVQIEGLADEPTGAEGERARALYFTAFPDGRERLAWPGITHFRIVPRWARSSDFGVSSGPLVVELDFPGRA